LLSPPVGSLDLPEALILEVFLSFSTPSLFFENWAMEAFKRSAALGFAA